MRASGRGVAFVAGEGQDGRVVHRALRVTLDPAFAGRHDGYVTKADPFCYGCGSTV